MRALKVTERRFPAKAQVAKKEKGLSLMSDLIHRPRRLRKSAALRAMVRETHLRPEDFILPLFACPGEKARREITSMPGVHNLSVDEIAREATAAFEMGVRGVILFGLPESKNETGTGAYAENGIVQ